MDLFRATMKPVKKVMEDADMDKKEVDEIILVGGSTRIPKVQQLVKDFFNGKEPSRGVNPDEAVAFGAAVQACILSGGECGEQAMVLLDVNPLSLGIETVGGVMSTLIQRNSVVPAKKSQVFSTAQDNQDTVTISVYEGERPMTKENHLLGTFDLTGIPPAPRGTPQIEVTFEIDSNGILQVAAKDKGTNKENKITITNDNNRLSDEDIQKMIDDAEKYAEEDKLLMKTTEARNGLEQYAYTLTRQLDDDEQLGGKVSDEEKEAIKNICEEKLEWLKENHEADADAFDAQKKEIEAVAQPIISKLYASGDMPPPGGDFGGGFGGAAGGEDEEPEDYDEHTEL